MKTPYLLTLAFALCLSACKKNETGNPADTDPTVTSLERLADANADNYCVLVINTAPGKPNDTIVWQTTTADKVNSTGGAGGSAGKYNKLTSATFSPAKPKIFHAFNLQFLKSIPSMSNVTFTCETIDSIIPVGTVPLDARHFQMSLTDTYGLPASTWNIGSPGGTLEVLKTTRIMQSNGCWKLRVKAKFSNIQMGPFACIVPAYKITEGVVQIDFKLK